MRSEQATAFIERMSKWKTITMLHIITTIFCFLLSPFRALHNCLCKKRLRKQQVLPKYVNEEDSIDAHHHDLQERMGLLSPGLGATDHIVDFKQACYQENDHYFQGA